VLDRRAHEDVDQLLENHFASDSLRNLDRRREVEVLDRYGNGAHGKALLVANSMPGETDGSHRTTHKPTTTVFICVKASTPDAPLSSPQPDCL